MSDFELHPQLALDCFLVTDLQLSRVLLMNDSNYPWCILVPRENDIREVYELSAESQEVLAGESAQLSRVMMDLFAGYKMNVAALGNMVPQLQLHVHHIVRRQNDPAWPKPVWGCVAAVPYYAEEARAICGQIAGALTTSERQ